MIVLRLLFQTVVLALSQILSNKFRAVLTTLGVIIGVAAIIAVTGVMTGFERFILSEFEKIGTKRIFIDGELPQSMRHRFSWKQVQITVEEVRAIERNCPSLEAVAPMWFAGAPVEHGRVKLDGVRIAGIWPSWHLIENRQVIQGRPFSSIDEGESRQVCLINDQAIKELELPKEPVGSYILVGGRRFLVVGVVETLQAAGMFGGGDVSSEVFVPFATSKNLLNPDGWVNMMWGQLRSPELAEDAQAEIAFVMRSVRGLEPGEEDTFVIRVFQQFIDQFKVIATGVTALLAAMVGIALLVGGIGIMNIMLVSVTERTREIGLRKAMGARPSVILVQFLVEAVVLCLFGAAVGWGLGQAGVLGLRLGFPKVMGHALVPWWAVVLSVGFSMFIGVVFGMFPAVKAARLDPIDALRHE